ncbi:MAG: hypothetical protein IKM82_01525 [Oscillospiraceae bacterium]|nr:hypothetical protein [Oscillospiraceae bacterium]MBR7075190.1 hypothetical protein [Oscillospiraceae bacterium]
MGRIDEGPELTVYISNDEAEFQLVEEALKAEKVRYRVWTTAEYPVFGWTRWDPRLIGRRESRLRKVYHIEVSEQDRQNLIAANMVIRSITGKMFNAERVNEII